MFIAIILAISTAVATASGTIPAKPLATPAYQAVNTNGHHTTGEYVNLAEYTCGEGAVARQTTKHCEQ